MLPELIAVCKPLPAATRSHRFSARHRLTVRPATSYNGRDGFVPPPRKPENAMKGNPQILDGLNRALTIELTAINQYFCQSKMCKNWGFMRLAHKHYEESIGEMKHADRIIDRILFLEGTPEIARYDVIRVGTNVKEQFENDLKLEMGGVNHYNELVNLAIQLKDNGTHELALEILKESEEHVDWLETQLGLIEMVGLERYLAEQMSEEEEE
jgi:bacterioferritin